MGKSTPKAAALVYPKGADAPLIAAKGKGELAKRLVSIAREHNIPVVNNVELTNVLTLYEIGEYVPPATYEVLAGIFAFITRMEQKHERS
jgi:flagellar biosynthesis protein